MSVQQFCLRWNNHQPNFISVCSSLLHNGTLVDVTLAAEGRQLQAHKIVLSACSSYFQTLFTSNPCQHPIVILKDVQYDDLKTMVDFMYYGEVNVSQEQLPHILKTAEMLKIKGLAEMPTDPANLTKSENKLNEPTELTGGANSISQGNTCSLGGGTDRLGSASGSASDSIWENTESNFQQQQQHQQHQLQQQHHHQEQHHHPQQQLQPTQQQSSLRRTPSPMGGNSSLSTRRKRLRKSSNNGSGERNGSEDQQTSSLDLGTGVSLSQMCQMSFSSNQGQLSGIGSHLISTAKLLKEASNVEAPQDSDSLDDGRTHVPIQIKPEVDISGVQSIPLDISGATTPSEHEATNSQSTHSGLQWTVVDSNYSRFSLSSCQPNLIGSQGTNAVNSGSNTELQQHQRSQQHQQQEGETASGNHQEQQQHMQQLQHYQQQHSNAYTSQIISVNSLVGGYSASNSQQNLSPPSPNIVQTVYSQGTTPMQSPLHPEAGISNNGASSIMESNSGSGISGSNIINNGSLSGSANVIGNSSSINGGSSASSQIVKRKRSVNPQGDENFIRALEAVRSGGIGFCKAARLYGVNNRTLWLEYKKRGYPVSRPSIKSRMVKQEPNLSPSPTPPVNTTLGSETANENYDHIAAAAAVAAAQSTAINMQIPPASETSSSLMCAPHHASSTVGAVATSQHAAMGVMSFLDTRHVDLPALHNMPRQRYVDTSNTSSTASSTIAANSAVNVTPTTAMNLNSMNFSSI